MTRSIPLLCVLISGLTACTSVPDEPKGPVRSETLSASETAKTTDAPGAGAKSKLSEAELALLHDPTFKKRFVESYLSETEVEPSVTVLERDRLQEVLELISSDKLDEAERLLEKQGVKDSSAVFDFMLAHIRYEKEEYARAAASYRSAIEKHPKFRRAWQGLGQVRFRQGDFARVVKALTRVITLGGGDGSTYGLLGVAYANVGNHVSAESAFRMAALLDPDRMDWKLLLAESLFKQQRYADVVALCNTLIAEKSGNPRLWVIQANAYVGLDKPLRAAENLEFVDRLGKSTAATLNLLGDIYVNEKLFELAGDAYIRALEKDPRGYRRAIRAAQDLAARGGLDESGKLVQRIEASCGKQLETGERKDLLRLRARVAMASGASEEEARVLEEIVELDPLDGEALILLGQHASRAGNPDKAIFYYERAAGLEKFEADAKVRHAQLLVGQGKYAEALPLLRSAQSLKPREHVQAYLEQVERAALKR
jgi:tetratricopeptide (TPR) repeat protein